MKFYVVEAKREGAAFPAVFRTREEAERAREGYRAWQLVHMHLFIHELDELEVVELELIKGENLFKFLGEWYWR